jgi:hypothetical protein
MLTYKSKLKNAHTPATARDALRNSNKKNQVEAQQVSA